MNKLFSYLVHIICLKDERNMSQDPFFAISSVNFSFAYAQIIHYFYRKNTLVYYFMKAALNEWIWITIVSYILFITKY